MCDVREALSRIQFELSANAEALSADCFRGQSQSQLVYAYHDTRCLDDGVSGLALFQLQLVDRFIGDGGCDGLPANIDTDMGRGGAFLDIDDLSLELVARAEFHGRSSELELLP